MEAMTENCMEAERNKYWKEFESNRHHFFKILVGDFRDHLRLPKRFVSNFREKLSGTMHLRGPSGFIWNVNVVKILDQVIFHNDGWEKFVTDHRLEEADILVFRYMDNSMFNVIIFDPSGCEREGSYFINEHTSACSNEGCVLEKEDEEDSEKIKRGRGRPRRQAVDTNNHHQSKAKEKKKPRAGKSAVERVVLVDESDRVPGCAMEGSREQSKMKRPVVEKIHTQENIKKGTGRSSLKVAANYNSHQSKAAEKKKIRVGKSVAENEVSIDESDGDSVCEIDTFEKQNLGNMTMQLGFPASYKRLFVSNRREITEEERKRSRILAEQHSSRTRRPSFSVVMKASHVYKGFKMRIPKPWHVVHIIGEVKRAILKVPSESKIWDVGIHTHKYGKDFVGGWSEFVLDNNLEEHDACVFELNDKGKDKANGAIVVFNVSIFRVLDEIVPLTKFSGSQCLALTLTA